MAGRGRGRGKMSFSTEQLGFGRGEALPQPNLQPPPTYPSLGSFPSPLSKSPENVYMGTHLGEQRRKFQASSFYVLADSPKPEVERYSDKFQVPKAPGFKYDVSYLPAELRPAKRKKKRVQGNLVKRVIRPAQIMKKMVVADIDQKLKVLEETEAKAESGDEEGEEEGTEEKTKDDELEEEVEDEEELEEETDYVSAYFDNGEGYLDDDEDKVDDGPVY